MISIARNKKPPEKEGEGSASRRFTATFSEEVYATLLEMAHDSGKSLADVLRDAIILEKWVRDARKEGYRIFLERNDALRELVLR